MDSLHEMSQRAALTEEEPWREQGIHKAIVKHYLMYFGIDEETLKVQITSVVYGGRNQHRILEEMRNPEYLDSFHSFSDR